MRAVLLAVLISLFQPSIVHALGKKPKFDVTEASLAEIHAARLAGATTPEKLVRAYQERINEHESRLNAFSQLNGNALEEAKRLPKTHGGKKRSLLYGAPILVKDNIDVAGMPTTGGSLALSSHMPQGDSFIVRKLRAEGAILLGKGTLSEFAGFMSLAMPAGYSSHSGFGFNPYDPRQDPRTMAPFNDGRPVLSPGGSSSGSAIAANASLAAASIGTDTSGSLLTPASQNGIVGLRPTIGLVSRSGILPITADQDTAGPLGRTVADAAILLSYMTGHDPEDPATSVCLTTDSCRRDYVRFLDKDALRGARIAVPREVYWGGLTPEQVAVFESALEVFRQKGATVVEKNLGMPPEFVFPPCLAYGQPGCSSVMLYGFKRDLNKYLGGASTLSEIRAFNLANPSTALKYGQSVLDASDQMDLSPESADSVRYLSDREKEVAMMRGALDGVYNGDDATPGTEDDFDVIFFPFGRGSSITARSGYPAIVLPAGFAPVVANPPFPPDFVPAPSPVGFGLTARAFHEARLLAIAYAYEQASRARKPPALGAN